MHTQFEIRNTDHKPPNDGTTTIDVSINDEHSWQYANDCDLKFSVGDIVDFFWNETGKKFTVVEVYFYVSDDDSDVVIQSVAVKIDKEEMIIYGLSVRSQNLLKRLKITNVSQLLELRFNDLVKMPNIGRRTLRELRTHFLAHYGIKLFTDYRWD